MKCEICGKDPSAESVTIYRVNPVGVIGIWRCWDHLTDAQRKDVDPETKAISEIIAGQPIREKVDYVLNQPQTRAHHCHWPGCDKQVPPAMWGCRQHWFKLPKLLRDKIWRTFRPGQETNWTPSAAYRAAAKEVQDWIKTL